MTEETDKKQRPKKNTGHPAHAAATTERAYVNEDFRDSAKSAFSTIVGGYDNLQQFPKHPPKLGKITSRILHFFDRISLQESEDQVQ